MGVPAFFRWLTRKYPSVIVDAVEDKPKDANGKRVSVDTSKPNPNFQEFDNLYLDMNGIIHPCTHPEDRPPPETEDEMFVLIFEYIDRIFSVVRPRRLLYMAIDGVAPRAKMNQQRSRRFRSSKEAAEKAAQIAEIRSELEAKGCPLPEKKETVNCFDSNCITPGTPFMERLAVALQYYIHNRLSTDPGWGKIEVILSDASVPGEGEHKIIDFIRRQRCSPSYDPNTVHCLCGADADLIMLGLATHESNFNILREEFVPNQQKPCDLCGQYGHEVKDCRGLSQDEASACQSTPLQKDKNFIFVRLPVLREYLERELIMPDSPITFDLERLIDDWVFLCFLVGNDFLPHLPCLEIRENAIDNLIKLYKDMIHKLKGYLTDNGEVCMERLQMILGSLGEAENEIFRMRKNREVAQRERAKTRARNDRRASAPAYVPSNKSLLVPVPCAQSFTGTETRTLARDARIEAMEYSIKSDSNNSRKRKHEEAPDLDDEPPDEVRLWESGYKDRYYESKFGVATDNIEFRRKVAWAFVEGLCWVLKYYYQGCVSWDWYFPYHYAPFASDFDTISQFVPDFTATTEPFKPFEQLMGVLPAASRHHLPLKCQDLMTNINSPIIDFYPEDFRIDLNGKKYAWQGVALLPFVDEKRLLETLKEVEKELTVEELRRNQKGCDKIFVGCEHPLYSFLQKIYTNEKVNVDMDPSLAYGMVGQVSTDVSAVLPGSLYLCPVSHTICSDIKSNCAISALYYNPTYEEGFVFPAKRLAGATEIPRVLKPSDCKQGKPFYPQVGFSRNIPRAHLSDAGHRMISHEAMNWRNNERTSNAMRSSRDSSYERVQSSSLMRGSYKYNNRKRFGNSWRCNESGWRQPRSAGENVAPYSETSDTQWDLNRNPGGVDQFRRDASRRW
uniref:5'-3' exoribonuclease n=1 Tax=Syphacia muris TaxID=451379 RepID=A0A0N5A7Q7_9BILA